MLESMRLFCPECKTTFDDLIERSLRDELHRCIGCNLDTARRIMSAPYIRTEDSASTTDGTHRFDKVKKIRALQKQKAEYKERRDRESEKKVSAELNKLKGSS